MVSKALVFKSLLLLPDKNQNAFHQPLLPQLAADGHRPLFLMYDKHSPAAGPLHMLWPLPGMPDLLACGSQLYLSRGPLLAP